METQSLCLNGALHVKDFYGIEIFDTFSLKTSKHH